jgi:PAS domain S-box-containing protein
MNSAQILGYPLLLLSALELFLGLLLLMQNPRNSPVNKATAACAFAAAVWSLSAALMYIRVSLGLDFIFFARANWIGWFTVPTALQTVLFLKDEKIRKARITGVVLYPFWFAALCLSLFTDLIVTDGYVPVPYRNSPGPLEMYFRIAGGMMVLWLVYEIVQLRRQVTGYRRSQLNYYLYGTIIFGTGGAVVGGFLQVFTGQGLEPSLSAYTSFPWVLMIFYAITRHRLFDIRIIFSRMVNILLLSFFISALQFSLFKILEPAAGSVASIFISVPIIGFVFFATPLSRNMQLWVNDLVLGGRYQYQKMLKESANAMITILRRDELLRYIIESVRSGLGVKDALLYLLGPNEVYSTRHCPGVNTDTLDGCILPHNVIECLRSTEQPIIGEEIALGAPDAGGLVETIRRIQAELILPLSSKGQMLGVLTLGKRQNGEPYLQSDIDVLQMLASHAAVAIENAQLFEEAGKARASQKESEDTFRILAETSTAGILIFRFDKMLYLNKAVSLMSGYENFELLNMNPLELVHPEYREMIIKRGEASLRGDQVPLQYEFKFIHRDGAERWALSSAATIEVQGRDAILATMVDITDLKQAEQEKAGLYEENVRHYQQRIAEEERHQKEKEKILKDLHDGIGGLTTNINLLAELARKNDDLHAVRKSLATISDLSRESLSEMRSFIQSHDSKELSWQAIAAELRHLGSAIIEPHGVLLAIDTRIDDRNDDPGSTVSMNLFRIYKESLANVIKHAKASAVEVSFTVEGGRVVLDIRDNGIGLDERRVSGRGLPNMKSRAGDMGGSLTVTSDNGTRVHLELPIP